MTKACLQGNSAFSSVYRDVYAGCVQHGLRRRADNPVDPLIARIVLTGEATKFATCLRQTHYGAAGKEEDKVIDKVWWAPFGVN